MCLSQSTLVCARVSHLTAALSHTPALHASRWRNIFAWLGSMYCVLPGGVGDNAGSSPGTSSARAVLAAAVTTCGGALLRALYCPHRAPTMLSAYQHDVDIV
jgi:hypothetical protein